MDSWGKVNYVLISIKDQDPGMYDILHKYYDFTIFQCDQTSELNEFARVILCTTKNGGENMVKHFRAVSTAVKRRFDKAYAKRRYYSLLMATKKQLFIRLIELQSRYIKRGNINYVHTRHLTQNCVFYDHQEEMQFKAYYSSN